MTAMTAMTGHARHRARRCDSDHHRSPGSPRPWPASRPRRHRRLAAERRDIARGLGGQGRRRAVLDVRVQQLHGHAAAHERALPEVQVAGLRDRRHPRPRVLLRSRRGQHHRGRRRPRRHLADRARPDQAHLPLCGRRVRPLTGPGSTCSTATATSATTTSAKVATTRSTPRSRRCSPSRPDRA